MTQATISGLILPLQDRSLLLPDNLVAEVTPMAGLIVESRKERWVLGHKHWRNMRIPVISFETLSGSSLRKHSEYARIAVVQGSGANENLPFWGMLVQNHPRAVQITEKDVMETDEQTSNTELMAVFVKDNAARIPDLAYLEQQLISAGVVH